MANSLLSWPLAARGQQPGMPVIGFLHARSPDDAMPQVAAFRRGLNEGGYVEGQNVIVEYRWARGRYDTLPPMASELARLPATLLVAGSEPAALAAKAATSTIPVVFSIGADPVKLGLALSYNRPNGNATGVSMFTSALEAKRLGLLRELVPTAVKIGSLASAQCSSGAKDGPSGSRSEASCAGGRGRRTDPSSALDMVEDAGFATPVASNADEAIRILESRNDIRAVFTEVQMPGSTDGLKLARVVRSRWPPVAPS
jgi:ABC transporter substrate binding protein